MCLFNSHQDQHSSPLPSQKPYDSVSSYDFKDLMQSQPLPSSSPWSFNPLLSSHVSGEMTLSTRRGVEVGSRGRHAQGNNHTVQSLMISQSALTFCTLLPISSCSYRQGISICAHTGADLHEAKNLSWVSDINHE